MRLTVEQLAPFGVDGGLIHYIDTAFTPHSPTRVGIAVSGGGDSMALLHAAQVWSALSGVPIEAVTVNHGLRVEAADEAAMVGQICRQWDVPHRILEWNGAQAQGNLAAAGRNARYTLIARWAKERGIGGVLVGHTLDDVAETFLMRLARKAGVDGLAMMNVRFERENMRWARPFWQQSREGLRDYLRRHDVAWVDDPTNDDEAHERPKARKALAALAPLGITPDVLKSVALNMVGSKDALDRYTRDEARRVITLEGGDVIVSAPFIEPLQPEIERRLWSAALRYIGGGSYAPREQAMLDLHHGLWKAGKHTLAGCIVTKTETEIRFTREYNPVSQLSCPTDQIWDGRWALDGPHAAGLTIRALGDSLKDIPDWRDVGLPRTSLIATPAVFDGETLISAPIAGLQNGFEARIVADFRSFLLSR